MKPLSRRTLLRASCGAALALPFLDAMRPQKAAAQTAAPRRIIFEFKPNGDEVSRRFESLDSENFVLGEFLTPLDGYRDDCLFLHRLNHNFDRHQGLRADNHQQGGSSLAPWNFGEGDFPVGGENRTVGYVLGPSADHVLGERVIQSDPGVAYRHLVYRVGDRHNDIWNLSSHAGPEGSKNPVLPETDPITAYARLFGFFDGGESESELIHNLEMDKSVLDLVRGQITSLKSKVSYEDRMRLDLHAESLRDLERTLRNASGAPACLPLSLEQGYDPYSGDEHVKAAQAFFKISVLALACDLTRVVNFNWSGNTNDRVYRNLGLADGHHTISHRSDAASFADIRRIHTHLWENTTALYDELMLMPDGDGTLWDNTLIFHWNELGQGDSHSLNDALVVLSGGAQGYFNKNRLIDFNKGGSFSNLLVDCFHYLGFEDVETFGAPALMDGTGGLAGVRA